MECSTRDAKVVDFSELKTADLVVDAVYRGGDVGTKADDPLARLLPCGNSGGFRFVGEFKRRGLVAVPYVVLYSSLADADWPDTLDPENGVFVYYGDNKKPGKLLHDTDRRGNELLRQMFDALHKRQWEVIPPVFVFTKGASGRDVRFRGLAIPGAAGYENEDLAAVWRSKQGSRFQNYRAVFSILEVGFIGRAWISDLSAGRRDSVHAPDNWLKFLRSGRPIVLRARRTNEFRTKEQQLPASESDRALIRIIWTYFREDPCLFEACAVELFRLMNPRAVVRSDLTRPWKDGGRDALGEYLIGAPDNGIRVEFALEAKRYGPTHGVGVRDTARLVARLRHRQFGVLVTTSYVALQAYKELVEDRHPVIVLSASDIVGLLKEHNIADRLQNWLENNFPRTHIHRTVGPGTQAT